MIYVKFFFCLDAFICCCCNYLLTWDASWCIAWNIFSFNHILLDRKKVLVVNDCICTNDCFNNVFMWKAIAGVALNTFPNVLLIFNISQCLVIISLIFCKIELYVTENGITLFCTALVLFDELISPDCLLFRFDFEWWMFS